MKATASPLRGKVCVVTGGGSGIGRSIAEEAARSGASAVLVADIDLDSAKTVASSLPALPSTTSTPAGPDASELHPCQSLAIQADCGLEMDVRRIINTAWSKFGRIDAYFSNAGVLCNGGAECSDDEWDRIWKINSMSHVWAARHLVPRWEKAGMDEGTFVITASAAGLLAQIGSLPYTVTKRAAVSIAEWIAISHGGGNGGGDGDGQGKERKRGVRVNVHCICPQAVRTGMVPPGTDGDFAGLDGVLTPEDVARETMDALSEGRFLVLPHEKVSKYVLHKAKDVDRWIRGMRKLHDKYGDATRYSPTTSKL